MGDAALGLAVVLLLVGSSRNFGRAALALVGAGIATVISSRVSTFQSAQNYSSLILVVLWMGLAGLLFLSSSVGLWAFATAVLGMYVLDVLLIVLSALTWRREEVMARQ